jgi:hypothetical protein
MKVTKGKNVYVCIFLRPGYFETGILNTFLRGSTNDDGLPAYFWSDNCDYDDIANCYLFSLPTLANKDIEGIVHIPREYVLAVVLHIDSAPPAADMGRIGFELPPK